MLQNSELKNKYVIIAVQIAIMPRLVSKRDRNIKNLYFHLNPHLKKVIAEVINDFVSETSFQNLEEYGCAVCGALTSIDKLTLLADIDRSDLDCLIIPDIT